MSEPLGGPAPLPNEAVLNFQTKRITWHDETTGPTICEVLVYYDTTTNRCTRATVENTSTFHSGLVIVTDGRDREVYRQTVTAPHPLQVFDLSGMRLTVRDDETTDKFSVNLGMSG